MNILITGTSSGVGNGLAKHYLKEGHTVYGISRKSDDALSQNKSFNFLSQDLSRFNETAKNVSDFLSDVSELGLVILNAGKLNEIKDMQDTTLDEIKEVMDINVWANKILIDTLNKKVKTIKQIVAISSGAAEHGSRGWNAYSLSKAALNMLIDLYSKELTETHLTALAPGLIDTNMQDYIYKYADQNKFPVVQKLKKAKGTPQMPQPEDAAPVIAEAIEKVKRSDSGKFLDVRNL